MHSDKTRVQCRSGTLEAFYGIKDSTLVRSCPGSVCKKCLMERGLAGTAAVARRPEVSCVLSVREAFVANPSLFLTLGSTVVRSLMCTGCIRKRGQSLMYAIRGYTGGRATLAVCLKDVAITPVCLTNVFCYTPCNRSVCKKSCPVGK